MPRLSRKNLLFMALSGAALMLLARNLAAAEPAAWEVPAKQLQATTVTVRVSGPEAEGDAADDKAENGMHQVSVCSGIFVAPKLLITSTVVGSDSTIRITLGGGAQAKGSLRVVDEFSRLVLLEVGEPQSTFLSIHDELPVAGAAVMTASAWGTEKAIVSQGIVGAVDRTLPDLTTPALLQCDLRTTETSAGAGVVDREGKLVGVIIAADHPETKRGWAYAIPASHVKRLLRTFAERKEGDKSVIVVPRRRPTVGVTLDGDDHGIFVRRVLAGSPAEKAGLAIGDRVLATDGVQIRSVYQALLPTMQKQPGDLMSFKIQRGEEQKELSVVLGGGVAVPSASVQELGQVIRPQVDVRQFAKGPILSNSPGNPIRELSATGARPMNPKEDAPPPQAQQIDILTKALERYRSVIEIQQRELAERDQERAAQKAALEALRQEVERLKKVEGK